MLHFKFQFTFMIISYDNNFWVSNNLFSCYLKKKKIFGVEGHQTSYSALSNCHLCSFGPKWIAHFILSTFFTLYAQWLFDNFNFSLISFSTYNISHCCSFLLLKDYTLFPFDILLNFTHIEFLTFSFYHLFPFLFIAFFTVFDFGVFHFRVILPSVNCVFRG